VAVGLELAAGQLGDAVEVALVPPRGGESPRGLLRSHHHPVRPVEDLGQLLGLGGDLCDLGSLLRQPPAPLAHPLERLPRPLGAKLVGPPLEQVHQLFGVCDPPLGQVGLQGVESGPFTEEGQPGPVLPSLAERGLLL
jgi:hypothetical protein